ncbi:hypothetical protein CH352_04795 [Leptospira hartskeerlii]|uniref:DUF485 domain-containing protein n=1 Tax=Leptospira hartskeerlii TaxID=2023177 RepID=A0A2M9XFZ7_9LEPT|nr:DUF485 domain-containing protein [Leptospira hartskeerlii]PJZ26600.1 hypothetical protein CH357_03660 [Leptospira hartskeerlii]PJZ34917.1 hypothetical protein CH352_04795 [Leptospira hartskeerlii]
MKIKAHQLIESIEFKKLVRTRWTVSFVLLFFLFLNYYGFILIIALKKEWLTQRIGIFGNYGLYAGASVILFSWLLTFFYVLWANRYYDQEVKVLKSKLESENR